ncbi:MAG: hypothetical protein HC903_11100 [Methylacidiphilales bacterium]|nr:hypothetical protein [Candidatus Methylacidiphilales bacterium]NJR17132.1 hypothetical protein [Calothrix sp. CSU_2_0]
MLFYYSLTKPMRAIALDDLRVCRAWRQHPLTYLSRFGAEILLLILPLRLAMKSSQPLLLVAHHQHTLYFRFGVPREGEYFYLSFAIARSFG